jgi:hypothetical protein
MAFMVVDVVAGVMVVGVPEIEDVAELALRHPCDGVGAEALKDGAVCTGDGRRWTGAGASHS